MLLSDQMKSPTLARRGVMVTLSVLLAVLVSRRTPVTVAVLVRSPLAEAATKAVTLIGAALAPEAKAPLRVQVIVALALEQVQPVPLADT